MSSITSRSQTGEAATADRHDAVLGDGSEAELRPYEKVCPATGYTYYHLLERSPHVDEDGKPL